MECDQREIDNVIVRSKSTQKRWIILNVVHLSLVFFFIFAAYRALESIQSSLNFESGSGSISLSILYSGNFISCLFIAVPFVSACGPKWAIFIALFAHTIYIFANAWSVRIALFCASLLLGFVSSAIWIGQGAYITLLAHQYADVTGVKMKVALQKINSWFYIIYGFSGPVGNLASGFVLSWDQATDKCSNNLKLQNVTSIDNTDTPNASLDTQYCNHSNSNLDKSVCGPNHCPYLETHLAVMERPAQTLIYIMLAIFLVFNVAGIVLCGLLKNVRSVQSSSPLKKLVSVAMVMKMTDMQLMLMTFVHMAMNMTFFQGSFLQSFVACPYGISLVGYTMLAQGLGYVFSTAVNGQIAHIIPSQICVALAIAGDLSIAVTWLLWQPQDNQFWIILVYAVVNGVIHATYKVQFGSMTSLLFENNIEAAFAHYNLWGSLAHVLGFAMTSKLCFFTKDLIYITSICLFAISYCILEARLFRRKQKLQIAL